MEQNTAALRLKAIAVLPIAVLMLVIGSAIIGTIMAIVGSFFYLSLVFPIAMGVGGSTLVSAVAQLTNIRKTGPLVLLSVLTAGMIYGSYHYGRYVALQVQTLIELSPSFSEAINKGDLGIAKVIVDYGLQEETGRPGFPGYMLYRAKTGFSIGRFYSQNRLVLTSYFAWLYWAAELGVVAWVAFTLAGRQERVPVCEACGRRYGREQHLGGTDPHNEALLLELLRRNDMIELGRLLKKDAGLPSVELYIRKCEACGKGASYLTVSRASLTPKGSVSVAEIGKATLQPRDRLLFLQQLRFERE